MASYAEKKWGNCKNAVAYQFNFVQFCYGYGNDCYDDYYNLCKSCGHAVNQSRDYEFPKSSFSKKDYYILDTYDYGVSAELMQHMLDFGVSENNFRPIYTRTHKNILGYQVAPVFTLSPILKFNGGKRKEKCKFCQRYEYSYPDVLSAYQGLGYPIYVDEHILQEIETHHITKTFEHKEDVIISLELYEHLIKKYPKIECRPVFRGNVTNDPEYLRLHK